MIVYLNRQLEERINKLSYILIMCGWCYLSVLQTPFALMLMTKAAFFTANKRDFRIKHVFSN